MTLEEAINLYERQTEELYKAIPCDGCAFDKCKEEKEQLIEWLKELVHLRNITEYLRDMVTCFEFMDSMHYNEDIIEWAESELRVDMREENADEDSD